MPTPASFRVGTFVAVVCLIPGVFGALVNNNTGDRRQSPAAQLACADLRCKSKFFPAYYHKIIDCLSLFVPALNDRPPCICTQHEMEKMVAAYVEPYVPRFACNKMSKTKFSRDPPNRDAFFLHRSKRANFSIVLMNRTNTRIFTHETYEALRKGLAALGSVYEFTGRESDTRIMDIFANTALIVGYHGAGFANAFYSPNGTCVIEISTEEDLSGSKPWRTNSVAISERIANRVRWVTTNINLKPLLCIIDVGRWTLAPCLHYRERSRR